MVPAWAAVESPAVETVPEQVQQVLPEAAVERDWTAPDWGTGAAVPGGRLPEHGKAPDRQAVL